MVVVRCESTEKQDRTSDTTKRVRESAGMTDGGETNIHALLIAF